jgi:GGDEF domain-containing protein
MQTTEAMLCSPENVAKSGLIDQVELGAALRHYFSQPEPTEAVLLNVQVHCTGDIVAAQQAIAQVLLKYSRPSDAIARVNPSRFLIACAGIGRSSAFELSELLRLRINSEISSGGTGQQHFTIQHVSIGISGTFSNYQSAGAASMQSQRALEEANAIGDISLAYRSAQG